MMCEILVKEVIKEYSIGEDVFVKLFKELRKEVESNKEKWCTNKVAFMLRRKLFDGKTRGIISIEELKKEYESFCANVNIDNLFKECLKEIDTAIESDNYDTLLRYYDNKGIMTKFAPLLHLRDKKPYPEALIECLSNNDSLIQDVREKYFSASKIVKNSYNMNY